MFADLLPAALMIDWKLAANTTNTLLSVGAGVLSSWLIFRAREKDHTQQLIDQLQEERDHYFEQMRREHEANLAAAEKRWAEKAAAQLHVNELRQHIWDRKAPPPPTPPAGYNH